MEKSDDKFIDLIISLGIGNNTSKLISTLISNGGQATGIGDDGQIIRYDFTSYISNLGDYNLDKSDPSKYTSLLNSFFNLLPESDRRQAGFPDDIYTYIQESNPPATEDRVQKLNDFIFNNKDKDGFKNVLNSLKNVTDNIGVVRSAVSKTISYNEKLDSKLTNGDAGQTVTTAPCPNIDMSKSPYEIYRRAYEEWIRDWKYSDGFNPEKFPNPAVLLEKIANDPKYFTDSQEKDSWINRIREDIVAYGAASMGRGGFDPDLFNRGDRLPAGSVVNIDFGGSGGTLGTRDQIQMDINSLKENAYPDDPILNVNNYKDYVEYKTNILSPPSDVYSLLNGYVNSSGKPLATDGKPIDYDFPGIDPNPKTRTPMLAPQEIRDLRLKIALKILEPDLAEFSSELETFKQSVKEQASAKSEGKEPNVLYKIKKKATLAFIASATLLESYKYGNVASDIINYTVRGLVAPDIAELLWKNHNLSALAGYAEAVLTLYKVIANLSNGKVGDAIRDAGVGVVAGVLEFAPGILGLSAAAGGAAAGPVGLALTVMTVYIDTVAKPLARQKNSRLLDSVLDLERMWIEKNCCIRIHPGLYRKTKGQVLVPVVTTNDPNSIDGIEIPAGTTYRRGLNPNTKTKLPCVQNNTVTYPESIKSIWKKSRIVDPLAKPSGQNIIEPPPVNLEKCDKPASVNGVQSSNPDFSVIDAVPYWDKSREEGHQDTILSFNMSYLQNEFNSRMESAYCRDGLIPAGGSNGELDDSYVRGDRLPLDTGDKFVKVWIQKISNFRPGSATPLKPERKDEWITYWDIYGGDENSGGDVSDRIKRRGTSYGGGRGGRVGKKPWEGEDIGDTTRPV